MTNHDYSLVPADAARLRAWMHAPEGTFEAGLLTARQTPEGSLVFSWPLPDPPRQSTLMVGAKIRDKILGLLAERAPAEVSYADIMQYLEVLRICPSRDIILHFLNRATDDGLVESRSPGSWCATVGLVPSLCDEVR